MPVPFNSYPAFISPLPCKHLATTFFVFQIRQYGASSFVTACTNIYSRAMAFCWPPTARRGLSTKNRAGAAYLWPRHKPQPLHAYRGEVVANANTWRWQVRMGAAVYRGTSFHWAPKPLKPKWPTERNSWIGYTSFFQPLLHWAKIYRTVPRHTVVHYSTER